MTPDVTPRRRAAGARRGAAPLPRGRAGAGPRPEHLGAPGRARRRRCWPRIERDRAELGVQAVPRVGRRAVPPQAGPDRRAAAAHRDRAARRLRRPRGAAGRPAARSRRACDAHGGERIAAGPAARPAPPGGRSSASTWPSWRSASTPSATPPPSPSCWAWPGCPATRGWTRPSAQALLEERLAGPPPGLPADALSPATREVLDTFQAMARHPAAERPGRLRRPTSSR